MTTSAAKLEAFYPDVRGVAGLKIRHRRRIFDAERLMSRLPKEGDVLDIGCGAGMLLVELARRGHRGRLHGIDAARGAVGLARDASKGLARAGHAAPEFDVALGPETWPPGAFDVVCIVDVLHHVPPALQEGFLAAAAAKVAPGGLLAYKDMGATPWWCGAGNRLHDLVFAREWINYLPVSRAAQTLRGVGLVTGEPEAWRQLWYRHEMVVARRP